MEKQSNSLFESLVALYPESSKSGIKAWIKWGRITVNDRIVKNPNSPVRDSDNILLNAKTKSLDLDIEILYEDRDIVVINKPKGVLSVATHFDKTKTVHDILKRKFYKQRVYPVHRLDRETSGVLVFAYTQEVRDHLKVQFHDHTIGRKYCAVVEGVLLENSGTWECNLIEDPNYVVHVAKQEGEGKKAITHFEVMGRGKEMTLLGLTLETGRKNQIRAHCKDVGHPIVGDLKYGSSVNPINRLALHAYKLDFIHPTHKRSMIFQSDIPPSFLSLAKRGKR